MLMPPRINLRVYINPGQIEVFCNILRMDGNFERVTTVIDTGAEVSFFPIDLLDVVAHDVESRKVVSLEQAGIAQQQFDGVECMVTAFLEDMAGNQSTVMNIPAVFADTGVALLGFEGVLDRSIVHVDMPRLTGYIEIEA